MEVTGHILSKNCTSTVNWGYLDRPGYLEWELGIKNNSVFQSVSSYKNQALDVLMLVDGSSYQM